MPKAFCQKKFKLSFGFAELAFGSVPVSFFFGSFNFVELVRLKPSSVLFGRAKRNEHRIA
jgi:hypothetical protein